jgi:hypothetical protein
MNPDIIPMIEESLAAGFRVLILTNAMKPMQHKQAAFLALHLRYPDRMTVRVSLDHYTKAGHEQIRGARTFDPSMAGLTWLSGNGFDLAIAGRTLWPDSIDQLRQGFAKLFKELALKIDANDPARLVLFPEMDESADVPEISTACWGILKKNPADIMCATSRMVVRRKGAVAPVVVSCTLLPHDPRFEMGETLTQAEKSVSLNHSHCAKFCVLGGASCSAK